MRAAALPPPGELAVAVCFFPPESGRAEVLQRRLEQLVGEDGHRALSWRDVPVEPSAAGKMGREAAPKIMQLLIGAGEETVGDQDAFERALFLTRRRAEIEFDAEVSFPSFSSRTIVYKGMLTAPQLPEFYPDLVDRELKSRFAIVHSRFSTNTLPSWELAQPLRLIAHNGEINTALGNVNWMRAREATLSHPTLPGPREPVPADPGDRVRLGRLRPRARADHARRPDAAALDDDDGPAGPRGPRRHPARARRLLPLPRPHAGALGRPGGALLQRRQDAWRDGRPQRPAPGPLADHRRRLARDGLGVGHLHDLREEGLPQGPLPPRPAARLQPRVRIGPRRRRDRAGGGAPPSLRRVGRRRDQALRRHLRRPSRARPSDCRRSAAGSPSATRRRT